MFTGKSVGCFLLNSVTKARIITMTQRSLEKQCLECEKNNKIFHSHLLLWDVRFETLLSLKEHSLCTST